MGQVETQPLETFLASVKENLGCKGLKFVDGGKPVRRVAVGGGACASELEAVAAAGCDTFVTSDVKYNGFWDAKDLGVNLIDAGHFPTENIVIEPLMQTVAKAFPALTFHRAEHDDVIRIF
jgi:putative NIF3 family GTP cyclohydrolase 1 type 2